MTARPSRVVLQRRPAPAPAEETEPLDDAELEPAVEVDTREAPPADDLWPPTTALAAVGAAAVLAASAGDVFVAVLALCVAGGLRVGLVAGLAAAATVARWGTADLGAIAGDQAVLGVAVGTGDLAARLSSLLAALALVVVARRSPGRWPFATAVALGVGAATVAGGPAVGRPGDLAVRVASTALGVAAAVAVASATERRPAWARVTPVVAAVAGVVALGLGAWA